MHVLELVDHVRESRDGGAPTYSAYVPRRGTVISVLTLMVDEEYSDARVVGEINIRLEPSGDMRVIRLIMKHEIGGQRINDDQLNFRCRLEKAADRAVVLYGINHSVRPEPHTGIGGELKVAKALDGLRSCLLGHHDEDSPLCAGESQERLPCSDRSDRLVGQLTFPGLGIAGEDSKRALDKEVLNQPPRFRGDILARLGKEDRIKAHSSVSSPRVTYSVKGVGPP